MQLLAAAGGICYSQIRQRHTCLNEKYFVPSHPGAPSIDPTHRVKVRAGTRNIYFFSVFSLLFWSLIARKRLDATFGSRRGAILQPNPTTAHLSERNVFCSFGPGVLSIEPTHRVRVRAATRNIYFFSVFSLLFWSLIARKRLDATFGNRRGSILRQNPTTAHLPEKKVFFLFRHGAPSIDPTHRVRGRAATRNRYFFSVFSLLFWSLFARKRLDATFGSRRGAILQQNPTTAHLPKQKVFFFVPQWYPQHRPNPSES
jgi:hypothetical protein